VMQLYAIITGGFAKLAGTYSSGLLTDLFCINGKINYTLFWSIPLITVSLTLIVFLFVFPGRNIGRETA
ncbi:MAG: hypothetical protein ACOCSE_05795, partial [Chitinivibrionales bacterium]